MGNIPIAKVSAPKFKTVQFKVPKLNYGVKSPKTGISAKPVRPASVKITRLK